MYICILVIAAVITVDGIYYKCPYHSMVNWLQPLSVVFCKFLWWHNMEHCLSVWPQLNVPHASELVVLRQSFQAVPLFLQLTTSELWWLSGGERGDYQNCSVLYCVLKLCTVISTLRGAVLTVLWIGFCHTGHISLCYSFVFMCSYFVFFSHTAYFSCYSNTVKWTWWDWSLIFGPHLPSVLWHCWLGYFTRENPSPIWPIMCSVGR